MSDSEPPREREVEPLTGLPLTPEPAGAGPGQRIRIIGLIAGIFLVLGAGVYFFSGQEFTPAAVVLMVLAAVAALLQSVLVIREIVRDR
jgi:hypothetical protein